MTPAAVRRGDTLDIRVLHRDDAEEIRAFFDGLSTRSRYLRFCSPVPMLSPQLVRRLTDIDHRRHEAVGVFENETLVGVASYCRSDRHPGRAEIGVAVADGRRRRGLGAALLGRLAALARGRDVEAFVATMLAENVAALALLGRLHPDPVTRRDGPMLTAVVALA